MDDALTRSRRDLARDLARSRHMHRAALQEQRAARLRLRRDARQHRDSLAQARTLAGTYRAELARAKEDARRIVAWLERILKPT